MRVGIQLLDPASGMIGPDFARCELSGDVRPGESCTVTVPFTAPADPGRYELKFDLVAEGVTWFGSRGTTVEIRPFSVTVSR